jgi:hypothetical protein
VTTSARVQVAGRQAWELRVADDLALKGNAVKDFYPGGITAISLELSAAIPQETVTNRPPTPAGVAATLVDIAGIEFNPGFMRQFDQLSRDVRRR